MFLHYKHNRALQIEAVSTKSINWEEINETNI